MKSRRFRTTAVLAAGAVVFASALLNLHAADGTWNSLTSGNWSDPANWSGGAVADGAGAIANLTANFTNPITLTLDSGRTIGTLNYNDSGGNPDVANLTLSHASSVLTLDAFAGSPDINITGTNVLILDVVLAGSEGLHVGKTGAGTDSRIYLNKPATFTGDVTMRQGRLYLNAGNNTLPTGKLISWISGTGGSILCLNGTTQSVAGLTTAAGETDERVYNDSATPAMLIINVPGVSSNRFDGSRLGQSGLANENNFGITKEGTGVQTINQNGNSYAGETIINNGILDINNAAGTLGSTAGGTTVNPGGTLTIRGTDAVFAEPLTLKGTGFGGNGALNIAGGGGGVGNGPTLSGSITLGANATIRTVANLTASGFFTDNSAGFGFTKTGAGSLNLGSAFLTGASFVNEGTLSLATSTSLGGLTLASGTTLNVTNQVSASSLAFSSGSAVLNLHYGTVGGFNPTTAAIDSSSSPGNVALANNATVTINLTGSGFVPTAGTPIVLIDYGTKTGTGSFVKGSLPPGVVGTVTDDGSRILLNISAVVGQLTWFGGVNANWDLATKNWNSGAVNYKETGGVGDIVTFDDALDGGTLNTNVNVTTTVSPAIMNVANNGYPYRFSGAGKISTGAALNKSGFGSLTLAMANDYTNGTTILDGTVLVGNNAALGSGPITLNQSGGLAFPVLSSDSTTPRTLANGLNFAGAATVGDVVNKGALTFGGPVSFGDGGLWNVTFNSDVTWSGPLSLGGINKLGTNTLTLTGATANLTEAIEVRDGTVILDGITVTNLDTVRVDAQALPTTIARLVIRNGAAVTTLGTGNNIRAGQDSSVPGTNIFDLAGTFRTLNADLANGELRLERQSALYSEFNLLAGGDVHARQVEVEGAGAGVTRFNFNGGILRARNNNPTFMQGLDVAVIQNGGAIINTEGYDITIAQALLAGGTGGLTKEGAGTLTLTGSNTFSGNIVVNTGRLVISSVHAGTGGATVADGALLGLQSEGAGQSVRFPTTTVGSSVGGTLECRFYNQSGNPAAPAGFATNLTLNGTITVSVTSLAGATAGSAVPLIGYSTFSGTPTFVTGTLPKGVLGTVTNNPAAKQIELVITTIAPLLWTGASSALWDVATSANWSVAGVPDVFDQGSSVRFDDTSSQPNVVMVASVTPALVVVSNNAIAYNFSVSGGLLGGGAAITKEGTNVLTLGGVNTFSGTVTVKAGTLRVNNNASLGLTTVGTVVENGASLDMIADLSLEPISVSGDGVNGQGALTQSGDGPEDATSDVTLLGDTTFGSYDGQWDIQTGPQLESEPGLRGGGFKLTKVGPSQIRINGGGDPDNQVPPASFTNIWDTGLGDIEIREGELWFERRVTLGQTARSVLVHSNATLVLNNTAVTNSLGAVNVILKNLYLTNASLTLAGGEDATDVGNIFGGPIRLHEQCWISSTTTNGAVLTGVVSGPGTLVKIGGDPLDIIAANIYTGDTVISNGVLRLGPAASINTSPTIFVDVDGTFDVSQVSGYTLGAGQALKGFGAVNGSVLANGTVSPGTSIGTLTFTNDLTLAGTTVMELTRDGGLTNDVINVFGTLTYGGTLKLEVAGATALQVEDTFTLFSFPAAPGGVFSQVSVPAGYTFDTAQLGVDGTVKVTSVPPILPTTATNLSYVLANGQLTLTWPDSYRGWHLQVQTNASSVGLSSNWVTLPNSSATNSVAFPVDAASGTVFYRMSLQP